MPDPRPDLDDVTVARLLARLDTRAFQRADGSPTRVLVALNPGDAPFDGVVAFTASYPVRVPPGPHPVTVWDATGRVALSRTVDSVLSVSPELPRDRRLWSFRLEILPPSPIPAGVAVGWAAAYGESPDSAAPENRWADALARGTPLPLHETDVHDGTLLLPLALDTLPIDIMGAPPDDRPA